MKTIAILPDGTRLDSLPDMLVLPGRQWVLISDTPRGRALAMLLDPAYTVDDGVISVAHDEIVDDALRLLVDVLAHVRFSAPELLQLEMQL